MRVRFYASEGKEREDADLCKRAKRIIERSEAAWSEGEDGTKFHLGAVLFADDADTVRSLLARIEALSAEVAAAHAAGQVQMREMSAQQADEFGERANYWSVEIAAAIRALALSPDAPAAGAEWRSIETAPKDGTVVDLWSGCRFTDCRWNDQPYTGGIPWGWGNAQLGRIVRPTHWQPLPPPPARKREGGDG